MQQILRALAICSALAVMPARAADEARAPQVVGVCATWPIAQWLGCYGVVAMDLSISCAWRRRIMKHPKADRSDESHFARCIERGY